MNIRILTIATLITTLGACSSIPQPNLALDQAQSQLNAAESNSQVTSLAATELTQAQKAMKLAKTSWEKQEDPAKTNHLAYMASQRVKIAQDTASNLGSQAITANASAERDKILLKARINDANQAEERNRISANALAQAKIEASENSRQLKARTDEANQAEERNRISAKALAATKIEASENDRQHKARVSELESELESLNARQSERGIVITLGDVLFKTGKSETSTNNIEVTISTLADFLIRHPQQQVSIEGHTDSTGNEAGNYILSQQRADVVKIALINKGVNRNQLSTLAFGESRPIADNDTVVGRQLNRRVDIVFEQTALKLSNLK